jgi:hypothetical protein
VNREILRAEVEARRERQKRSALNWLLTGEQDKEPPPYGAEWDRNYNPMPYPEASPGSATMPVEFYVGTGVGLLYGLEGSDGLAWQLAGWLIPRNVFFDQVRSGKRTVTKARVAIPSETRKVAK